MDYKNIIAGVSAGTIEVTSTHWLDVIKTRSQEIKYYKSNKTSFWEIGNTIRSNSIFDFYKGYGVRVINVAFMRLIFWNSQQIANNKLNDYNISKFSALSLSGVFCGFVQTTIDTPFEVIKTRQIMTMKNTKINLYAGFIPNALRNSIFALWVNLISNYWKFEDTCNRFIVGAIGGGIGAITSHPFDVIKTELQRPVHNYEKKFGTTTFNIFKNMYKTDPKLLMCGCFPRTIQSVLTMGIGYSSYMLIYDKLSQ